ncbi:unnamed protein product, partial [Brassica oleracea var. botrytis]
CAKKKKKKKKPYLAMASSTFVSLPKPFFAFSVKTSTLPLANHKLLGTRRGCLRVKAISTKWEPTKVVPQADRVLVRLEELAQTTSGGVLLPKAAVKFERYLTGEVVSVGSEVGQQVGPGKKVLFSDVSAYEVDLGTGARHCFCKESDLLALVDGGGGATVVSSSSRLRDLVFVVNPQGANGRTAQEWNKLLPYLRSRLGGDCNICESLTSGPSHAIDITREAIRDGADDVIAVGGDGTLHEVVNGFFWEGKPVGNLNSEAAHSAALGTILRSVVSYGFLRFIRKNDPREAVERIAKGIRSRVDVGVINQDSHYFINVADVHLSAKAGFYASKYKKFGNLCYVIGALQAFMGHHNRDMRIKVNNHLRKKFSYSPIGETRFEDRHRSIIFVFYYCKPYSGSLNQELKNAEVEISAARVLRVVIPKQDPTVYAFQEFN